MSHEFHGSLPQISGDPNLNPEGEGLLGKNEDQGHSYGFLSGCGRLAKTGVPSDQKVG